MTRIYTVGHSTRSADELIALLRASGLELVADVRRWPWRCHRRFIARALEGRGWRVIHLLDVGKTGAHS